MHSLARSHCCAGESKSAKWEGRERDGRAYVAKPTSPLSVGLTTGRSDTQVQAIYVAIPATPSVISHGKAIETGESIWLPSLNDATAEECPSPPTLAFRARALLSLLPSAPSIPSVRQQHRGRQRCRCRARSLPRSVNDSAAVASSSLFLFLHAVQW